MDYQIENSINSENIKKIFESDIFLSLIVFFLIAKILSMMVVINIPHIPKNIFFADVTRGVLENLVNDERSNMGVQPLKENEKLDLAAQMKAQDMVQKGYFDHISPEGKTPWQWIKDAGYSYQYAGENLAVGFYDSSDVFQAWLNSPSHKENLLNAHYTEFGTAVVGGFGDSKANIIVQLFATPAESFIAKKQPKIAQADSSSTISPNGSVVSESNMESTLPDNPVKNNARVGFNTILGLSRIMDNVSYIFFVIAIGALSLLVILNFHTQNKSDIYSRKFIFRSVAIVAFLILSLLIDKNVVLSIIPNHIIIL
jgi:hypothetical protein